MTICIVGLGYVGLPLATLLAKKFSVIGFDISETRIKNLAAGIDHTGEVSAAALQDAAITFTTDPTFIGTADMIIIAVPTPVDENKLPDFAPLIGASETVGKNLVRGTIVVYESTVYPGATEEICVPVLENASGLTAGTDFFVGYSPERVNPGDKTHTIDKVVKIVSGMNPETTQKIAAVYGAITRVHLAPSIKVAEAAKVIENTQRDLNIALMNELAILFQKMGMSVYDVLDAAKTKWNFLPFEPGLVGGHCIGVDPYYLTYKAQAVGHNPEVILAGRGINDSMHKFIAHQIIKEMIRAGKDITTATFVIFGATFKENVSDVRNAKIMALYQELVDFGLKPYVYDPIADPKAVKREYGVELTPKDALPKADTLLVGVAHDAFRQMSSNELRSYMNTHNLLLADIKHIYTKADIEEKGIRYWTL